MPNLTYFYNHWEYWDLRHKVTFDGINKLILVNEGVTELDVQRDIYSAWKEWTLLESNVNAKYLQAFATVGGEPTVAGQRLDVTYFLINGWKLKPYTGTYDLTLVGNIFDVDGGSIKVPADVNRFNPNNITINTNTSVIVRQVDSGGGGGISGSVTASLSPQDKAILVNVENTVLSIESILQAPVTASLVQNQQDALFDIQTKLLEIYQLHGLEAGSPLKVTQTERTFAAVSQSISTTGSGSTQETIITRL